MIVVLMGVAGAGKTTIGRLLADTLHWQFVDGDSFHPPENVEKMRSGLPLSDDDRRPWLEALRAAIDRWLRTGKNVVLACSALTAAHRRALIPPSDAIRVVYLRASYDVIQPRVARRPHHFMPASLLPSQFALLEEPSDAVAVDAALPPDHIVREVVTKLRLTHPRSHARRPATEP